jgi:hypothetical protein
MEGALINIACSWLAAFCFRNISSTSIYCHSYDKHTCVWHVTTHTHIRQGPNYSAIFEFCCTWIGRRFGTTSVNIHRKRRRNTPAASDELEADVTAGCGWHNWLKWLGDRKWLVVNRDHVLDMVARAAWMQWRHNQCISETRQSVWINIFRKVWIPEVLEGSVFFTFVQIPTIL